MTCKVLLRKPSLKACRLLGSFASATISAKEKQHHYVVLFPFGRNDRIRTCDILLPKQARYQLRYIPIFGCACAACNKHNYYNTNPLQKSRVCVFRLRKIWKIQRQIFLKSFDYYKYMCYNIMIR